MFIVAALVAGGANRLGADTVIRAPISGSLFAQGGSYTHRFRDGELQRVRGKLTGRFSVTNGYRVSGRLKVRHVFSRGRRRVTVCAGTLPFSGH